MLSLSASLVGIFSSLPRTTRGQAIVLGADPKGKNFLYTNGNSVFIRDIENPAVSDVYTEHYAPTFSAKYSPSGNYIASGDQHGKLRIWDTTQKEHILKNEFQPLGGVIKDIAWSSDNQRIIVGGDGREKFGHAIMADTGSSVGEISGSSKPINSVDFKSSRPFRAVTGSEDATVAFFEGPPFRFKRKCTGHTNFVNAVRYAPNGEKFVSGGADGKVLLFDGNTGDSLIELGNPAHKGQVYSVAWSPDSQHVLTASGDKTAKIWDAASGAMIAEFKFGAGVEDQQVGCLWQGSHILTVALSGFIYYLNKSDPSKPLRVIKGHNKPITALAVSENGDTFFTGSHDGHAVHWNAATGEAELVEGAQHTNQVQAISVAGDALVSVGLDDTVRFGSVKSKSLTHDVKMPSQPRWVATHKDGLTVVACLTEVVVLRNYTVMQKMPVTYEPACVAIHPDGTEFVIGGVKDNQAHIYRISASSAQQSPATEIKTLDHLGSVTQAAYSPNGQFLATADTDRKVRCYQLGTYENVAGDRWSHHSARINSLSWTPNSTRLASGGIDTHIFIYNPSDKADTLKVLKAHPLNSVNGVAWISNNELVSVGQDCCLRRWKVAF